MVAVVVVVALVGVVSMLNNDDSGTVVVNSGSELTGRASYECWFSCIDYRNAHNESADGCTSLCGF